MKVQKRRSMILLGIVIFVFVFFVGALFKIQIIDKDESAKNTVSYYTTTVDAARGEILDRNGSPLVSNRQGNSVVFNAAYFPSEKAERDKIIYALIKLFEKNGQEYYDTLPITLDENGKPVFIEDMESDIAWLKSSEMLDLNSYATAENCMTALIKRYELEEYSLSDARKIASVCAAMKRASFSTSYPYTFAEDVPTELISIILENGSLYKGVENQIVPYREYTDGTLAPHILGRVSKISAEKYKAEKEKTDKALEKAEAEDASDVEIAAIKRNSYRMNDEYGSGGLESAFESYLRGTRGEKLVSTDSDGNVKEEYTVDPKQGNIVITTIDAPLQKVTQKALAKCIRGLNVNTQLPVAAGAVVVENVNTGEILACATYPSYDNDTWAENYSEWASDEIGSPLWNRATVSTYEPGSTFKPCMAVAALEEGVITRNTTWDCNGYYTYFSDIEFHCAGRTAHGVVNVETAIQKSCNCFFFDAGRQLGIEKMNKWATAFGFGQKTGVEIPEAQGILAGREYREAQGGVWLPGDTVQAAIGQSDNQFTLLQMCNYCSTIANGGTRYVAHLVRAVMSPDYSKTIIDNEPKVAAQLNISQPTIDMVQRGMYLVATQGSVKDAFVDLPIKVAAKTGTSQVKKIYNGHKVEGNNGFLITYAPFDNPEIAIAVVIETANAGSKTASIASDIYKYYFSEKPLIETQKYNTLLK